MSIRERWNHQHWLIKIAFIIAVLWLLATLALVTSTEVSSGGQAKADPIPTSISSATIVYSNVIDAGSFILTSPDPVLYGAIPAKCHGRVWRRSTIKQPLTGFTYGWRQTSIDRWCNNTKGQITDWGAATGNDGSYSGGPWCWTNVTYGKVWNTVSRSEAKVWNAGTMIVCGLKLSPTRSVNPRIYFHSATAKRHYDYWNYGNPLHIYH